MDRTLRLGEVFKKKVSEILAKICNVPLNAAIVNKIANAEADFYGFRCVPRNANSVCLFLN